MSATTYQIDPSHSAAYFKVRHLTIANITGEFGKVTGSVTFDSDNPAASSVEASIEVASLYTRDGNRDNHLKAADFLDAEKHPNITFQSKSVASSGKDSFSVTGDLALHGVTKPVTVAVQGLGGEVKDPWGNLRLGAEAKTRLSRKDFGLTWNATIESGGFLISDEVDISLDIELVRKP